MRCSFQLENCSFREQNIAEQDTDDVDFYEKTATWLQTVVYRQFSNNLLTMPLRMCLQVDERSMLVPSKACISILSTNTLLRTAHERCVS